MSTEQAVRTSIFTDAHLEAWRKHGFVIVEGFLDDDELDRAREGLHTLVPTWEQYRDDREAWPNAGPLTRLDFPYEADALNDVTLHPALINFAELALGTKDIVLCHSEILAKYADEEDFDQEMHLDYTVNTFVVPPDDDIDQLAVITYYTDVEIDLGPTRVVSFEDSERWRGKHSWSREEAPELFALETPVVVSAGSILIYTMKTFHRGSAFTATSGSRYSHHISYQRAEVTWGGWRGFARFALRPWVASLMTRSDPRQRSMVGFPPPGHHYWNPSTIELVQRRYPEMDMSPYHSANDD